MSRAMALVLVFVVSIATHVGAAEIRVLSAGAMKLLVTELGEQFAKEAAARRDGTRLPGVMAR